MKTLNTVEEGNKLIAEFMGAVPAKGKFAVEAVRLRFPTTVANAPKEVDGDNVPYFGLDELKYHASWSWLMPVVEKIESLPCPFLKREDYVYKCDFNIMSGFIDLKFTQQHFTKTFHPPVDYKSFTRFYGESDLYPEKTKIEAVWQTVVQFIQWYNSTKL